MNWWVQKANVFHVPVERCGTAGCIAGWAVALHRRKLQGKIFKGIGSSKVCRNAGKILGFDEEVDTSSSDKLFITCEWPITWRTKLRRAKTPQQYANVVADRIEYFLETGK